MTFYKWLKKQKDRDDSIGDLAKDAISNPNRPSAGLTQDYRAWCEFTTRRLSSKKSIRAAINSLDRAWYEYMYDYKKAEYG